MKYSDFNYQRPNIEATSAEFENLLQQFDKASTANGQNEIMQQINTLRNNFDTMMNMAYINYSKDTTNEANQAEQGFFDENMPIYENLCAQFYRQLAASPFREELSASWGEQLFNLAEMKSRTFNSTVVQEAQEINRLNSEYLRLIASAKINFEGEERNLSQLRPYEMSTNRETRKRATEARWQFIAGIAPRIEEIYDQQVKLRHKMAQKLGFNNYVEMGYLAMCRSEYNANMVAQYRQQVLEVVVPIAAKLRQRQADRLGLDKLAYYDIACNFNTGNPMPKGNPEWILSHTESMYNQLCEQTNEFFQFMKKNELMDLVTRKGKAGGGYCTYIANYEAPFIFSNFNGTSDDINVLTHEAGHAFQVYMSRHFSLPEYHFPTYEACEIHSMSMEFIAWPWMQQFFDSDTEKFKFEHLSGALLFLPYGVTVDEFQHYVYENPNATPAERNKKWREIEKKYQPWVNYEGNEFLESGTFWLKQAHIFGSPFYYIDYTLAQICAFQFWHKSRQNSAQALADYVRLCSAGGSKPFLQLVEYANLQSPFDAGCLKNVLTPVSTYLDTVNDAVL
ncbi:MAG: M3 family oligoendopeptidase [Sphingobacteriales bacterium]|jgi:M3 family oligoendopeptidase|nr:M3 family oligoendopeptidase [Sphingobacteriales bacterium]MBP9140592.1 M3 family oligoendopeptidase [Chitinophagales bacterium]MDA0197382.1 M3 family oligoendopeptidase [Bacteroidota bacterium]MBK7528823.1 M3 family oligoendopeptidase [Sphingobacteriales bacterium]MBK8679199.1 M3 family oligoendopeptidase [Sphingobacteriales bacterium]